MSTYESMEARAVAEMRRVITKACDHTGIGLPYCEVCDTAYAASPGPLRDAERVLVDIGYLPEKIHAIRAPEVSGSLREAVLANPGVVFPNLPYQPALPDVLDAVAAWMDGKDDEAALRDQRPKDRGVQKYLRERAAALRAALRPTPAAPEFGGSLASVQPTPAAPQPECSLLLADGTICVKRAGHSDDHGMALRSTPAAPHQHRFDVVIRDDEHMRLLGCSNTPCEESYQWDR